MVFALTPASSTGQALILSLEGEGIFTRWFMR